MTIQEKTIEWLTLLKEKFIGTEYSMYLDAAIKALEQQSSDDCISRQAAIDIVVFECGEWIGLAREISKQLRQLPSVTPQQPNRCDSCTHSEEQDGSNCYECVKGMADNFEAQPTDMTIDEAIEDCEENDYGQIADWLRELKAYKEAQPTDADCISRAYIEPIVEELENICINGDEHILSLLSNIKNAPSVTPSYNSIKTELKSCEDYKAELKSQMLKYGFKAPDMTVTEFVEDCLPPVKSQPCKDAMFFKIIKDIEESDEQQVSYNEEFQLSKYAYVINNAETFKEMGYQVINEESVFGFDTVYLKRNKKVDDLPPITPRMNLAETSQDCISREALTQKLNAWDSRVHGIPNYAWKVIRELSSVTPQRPKGEWIQTKDECDGVNFYDFSFECSKCGKEQSFKSNYCPNCGSYNGGEKE